MRHIRIHVGDAVNQRIIARLGELSRLISRYKHRWGENTSSRLYGWVDEYDRLRRQDYETFLAYCKSVGNDVDPHHTGHDLLA